MTKRVWNVLFGVFIITVIATLLFGCRQNNNSFEKPLVNENIIGIKDFSVNSDSTELNTSAKGTVFIQGVEGIPEHIKIVALIEIDPDDWGGVYIYIPRKWNIESITNSYPENEAQANSYKYVSTCFTAAEKYEWNKWIEIGRSSSYEPTGGGTGTVVIDLVADKDAVQQSETFNIMIAVGSDEKNGRHILGPDSTSIEIP